MAAIAHCCMVSYEMSLFESGDTSEHYACLFWSTVMMLSTHKECTIDRSCLKVLLYSFFSHLLCHLPFILLLWILKYLINEMLRVHVLRDVMLCRWLRWGLCLPVGSNKWYWNRNLVYGWLVGWFFTESVLVCWLDCCYVVDCTQKCNTKFYKPAIHAVVMVQNLVCNWNELNCWQGKVVFME